MAFIGYDPHVLAYYGTDSNCGATNFHTQYFFVPAFQRLQLDERISSHTYIHSYFVAFHLVRGER
jgi:hypothetical protein